MSWTKPPPRTRQWEGGPITPRAQALRIPDTRARMIVACPKHPPLRSEPYRRWVASLPCAHCGRPGPSQCAHSDEGKGLSLKSSDAACFALCADRPGERGCHSLVSSSGAYIQSERRRLEDLYSELTKAAAKAENKWPKGWPE